MKRHFEVVTVARFDRLARALRKRHPQEFTALFRRTLSILAEDPHNTSGIHSIKKLKGSKPGTGRYRLRLRRVRFRYEIEGATVVLLYCGLRRENTYK